MFAKKKDYSALSAPKSQMVRGYEIKKMPIGAYLAAMNTLADMPGEFFGKCFPGKSLQEILDSLGNIDEAGVMGLASSLLASAPEYLIGLVAELTGIRREDLIEDENLGLDGLLAIIKAFIEVNQLGKLSSEAAEVMAMLRPLLGMSLTATGSND